MLLDMWSAVSAQWWAEKQVAVGLTGQVADEAPVGVMVSGGGGWVVGSRWRYRGAQGRFLHARRPHMPFHSTACSQQRGCVMMQVFAECMQLGGGLCCGCVGVAPPLLQSHSTHACKSCHSQLAQHACRCCSSCVHIAQVRAPACMLCQSGRADTSWLLSPLHIYYVVHTSLVARSIAHAATDPHVSPLLSKPACIQHACRCLVCPHVFAQLTCGHEGTCICAVGAE